MRQFMPNDKPQRVASGFYRADLVSGGPSRSPRPGKAGSVTVRRIRDGAVVRIHAAYSDKELSRIIEEGETSPRVLSPELVIAAERARVEGKEDLRALETQFAGIGVSGTYGSLDRRKPKREGSN